MFGQLHSLQSNIFKETFSICQEINNSHAATILPVTITTNNYKTKALEEGFLVSEAIFLKELRCINTMGSLPLVPLPEIEITDSDAARMHKMLDIEWNSPRKQINLYIKKGTGDWYKLLAFSLLNPNDYPYRINDMKESLTDNLAWEMGGDSQLAVGMENVGWGLAETGDKILVVGTYLRETYVANLEKAVPFVQIISSGGSGGNGGNTPTDTNVLQSEDGSPMQDEIGSPIQH